MKDYFGMTKEQFQKWLMSKPDEPDCGILACSPEIYEEMQQANKRALEELEARE